MAYRTLVVGCAIEMPYDDQDWTLPFSLKKNEGETAAAQAEQYAVQKGVGFGVDGAFCVTCASDVAALAVARELGLEAIPCSMHQGDKGGRWCTGMLKKSRGKQYVDEFQQGDNIMQCMHKVATNFSYGAHLADLHDCCNKRIEDGSRAQHNSCCLAACRALATASPAQGCGAVCRHELQPDHRGGKQGIRCARSRCLPTSGRMRHKWRAHTQHLEAPHRTGTFFEGIHWRLLHLLPWEAHSAQPCTERTTRSRRPDFGGNRDHGLQHEAEDGGGGRSIRGRAHMQGSRVRRVQN